MNIITIKKITMSEAEELSKMPLFNEFVMQSTHQLDVYKSTEGRGTYVATLQSLEDSEIGCVYFETDVPIRFFDGSDKAWDIVLNSIIDPHSSFCTD